MTQALTALYRKACAANPCRVLQWIEEGLQQQLQQLQQQQTPQQRREQQQQLSSLLHMILVMTDDIGGAKLCYYTSLLFVLYARCRRCPSISFVSVV